VISCSPLLKRAQTWPRGYPGDFETIEHIISQQNKAVPQTIGYELEGFFLKSDICLQHLNKIDRQAALISEVLRNKTAPKVLSIGCGTSEDVQRNLPLLTDTRTVITLVDVDKDALSHSLHALEPVREKIQLIHGNIYKIIRTLKSKYDLVIIGGVFDYLNDKVIVKILSSLKENLNPSGTLFFTNIKKHNPYRIDMEYLMDWPLIERSKEGILQLIDQSGCGSMDLAISTDKTNLTYLVEIRNK
jgi:extracellular factor (EF) 3-hydroxypalmitic acid methyl ester biosynthesis protein